MPMAAGNALCPGRASQQAFRKPGKGQALGACTVQRSSDAQCGAPGIDDGSQPTHPLGRRLEVKGGSACDLMQPWAASRIRLGLPGKIGDARGSSWRRHTRIDVYTYCSQVLAISHAAREWHGFQLVAGPAIERARRCLLTASDEVHDAPDEATDFGKIWAPALCVGVAPYSGTQ